MARTDCIRFLVTLEERQLLTEISRQEGDLGLSATLRRLIRAEAQRRGIILKPVKRAGDVKSTTQVRR